MLGSVSITESGPESAAPRYASTHPLDPQATVAAFPLGGIGTGNVSIGARGEFRDWELQNEPGKGNRLPFTFCTIDVRSAAGDSEPVTKVLEARLVDPHEGQEGYGWGHVAGLPRLSTAAMLGRYPMLTIDFDDTPGPDSASGGTRRVPVRPSLEAFTPLVPLDPAESGLPTAVLRYRVHNPTDETLQVTLALSLASPVGMDGWRRNGFPTYSTAPTVAYQESDGVRGLTFTAAGPKDGFGYGTATLTTTHDDVSVKPQWLSGHWSDGVQAFWNDLTADGRLEPETRESYDDKPPAGGARTGSLALHRTLAPGETGDFEFLLSWHVPNRHRAWDERGELYDQVVLNHYATRFADAWAVAEHVHRNLDRLESATRTFTDALFGSDLPAEVIDAAAASLSVARSTTCFMIDNGTPEGQFLAWEGSFDHEGSCLGTCTHVWNYAQTLAYVFPSLERSARRNEFLTETDPGGRMHFRSMRVFGDSKPWDFEHPAVDGQLGTVLRMYREWRFSGDDAFLTELWPKVAEAVDFAFDYWDPDGDLVLESVQHNTYDIEFHGPNPLGSVMFYGALRAAAAMAEQCGDTERAARYTDAAARGAAAMDELLYNGEYYVQRLDDVDAHRYQFGIGVLSDQLLGQFLAHLTGLGHVLDPDHVRSAIESVFRHNFRENLSDHVSVQRTYALNDEAGLILCSWPNGGRPALPFVYSDEVWTGIEYQVAAHLIFEGLVEEGLTVARAVRQRFTGRNRNPWNEAECGNHYARSMAAWALIIACTGFDWDASRRRLSLAPKVGDQDRFRTVFTTGSAQGRITLEPGAAEITVDQGELDLAELVINGRTFTGVDQGPIGAGRTVRFTPA